MRFEEDPDDSDRQPLLNQMSRASDDPFNAIRE
jgi:hypothetical protein